jgi:hypothetical protein
VVAGSDDRAASRPDDPGARRPEAGHLGGAGDAS